jgi:hypothetical protein
MRRKLGCWRIGCEAIGTNRLTPETPAAQTAAPETPKTKHQAPNWGWGAWVALERGSSADARDEKRGQNCDDSDRHYDFE